MSTIAMALFPLVPVLAAESERKALFEISAGPAQKSLLEFGYQSGLSVDFLTDDVQGSYTNAVNGSMKPSDALSKLLHGSPLCQVLMPSGKSFSVTRCMGQSPRSPGAQGPVPAESVPIQSSPLDQVLITGSNIHGVPLSSANMVSISQADLRNQGISTAAELVARLPELGATPFNARFDGNSGLGVAGGLRGQGADATLVLVNGHRLAGSGLFGSFVDLDNIPISSIDHIEVVLDGASAQYGTDAVGGVLNIITRSENQAPQFNFQLDKGTHYRQAILSQVVGRQWDSGVGVEAMEYTNSTTWRGPNLMVPQTQDVVDRVPKKELASAYAQVKEHLSPVRTDVTVEGIYSHRRSDEQYDQTLPLIAAVSEKTGVSVQMAYASAEAKTAIGADGVLLLSLNRAIETESQQNWPVGLAELADGSSVTPSTLGIAPTAFDMFSRTDQLVGKFDKSIASYSAGPVKVLIGGEYRWQTLNTLLGGESLPSSAGRYKRRATAGFGEVHIPITGEAWSFPGLRQLELTIAGRYEAYSDFQGRYTPQYSLHWVPSTHVDVIGSLGRSSRAPALPNLDSSKNSVILAPVANGESTSTAIVETGNRSNLTGESATSANLGAQLNLPFSSSLLVTSLDVFRIHSFDRIASFDLGQVQLTDPSYDPIVTRDLSSSQRGALCSSAQFTGSRSDCLTENVVGLVDLTLRNISDLLTEGLQFKANWSGAYGGTRAEVDIRGTYFFDFSERITPTAPSISLLRTQSGPPPLQFGSRFSLTVRDIEFDALTHYVSGFRDESAMPPHYVPAWPTFDFHVVYRGLNNMVISLVARNVFNKEFPLLNDTVADQSYDLLSGLSVRRQVGLRVQLEL